MKNLATASEPILARLADWGAAVSLDDFPKAAIDRAKLIILDTLGGAVAAIDHPAVTPVRATLPALGEGGAASVIGHSAQCPITSAILLNGAMVRALDFNDFYWSLDGGGGHPSDNIPVALAVGEACGASGRDVLLSVLIGYEAYCRLADLMDTGSPWDHVGVSGLAAAAMAGRLMGLDRDRLAHAMALGATYAHPLAALRRGGISQAKAVSNAICAAQGVFGALLAAQGLTGPLTALDGPFGLPATLKPAADLASIVPHPGDTPRISDVAIKLFPCIGTGQSAAAAALELRQRVGDAAALEWVEVWLPDAPVVRAQSDPGYRRPQDHETADHSFYFIVGAALLDGEFTPRQYANDRWADPALVSVMDRIKVQAEDRTRGLSEFPARLVAGTRNGDRIEIDMPHPPGSPTGPECGDAIQRKFRTCVEGALNDADAQALASTVLQFDTLDTLDAPLAILRRAGTDAAA